MGRVKCIFYRTPDMNFAFCEMDMGDGEDENDPTRHCTIFPKRNATLISRFLMATLDQGQWPQFISIEWSHLCL